MSFLQILSQDTAVRTLRRSLRTGKTAHAYLFAGPSGVGKHLTAKAVAAALNCEQGSDDACGACSACRKIQKEVHPDVFEMGLPQGKRSIPVDSVRELEKRLAVRPHEGRAKVAIIDPADRMTEPAANALLKTLEEPGPDRFLILITSRAAYLLPTVRSRCQLIRFNALPGPVVEKLLAEQGANGAQAAAAAALSNGSMTRAVEYLDASVSERVAAIAAIIASVLEQTPLRGLAAIEELRRGKGGARDEALQLIQTAPAVFSELLWLVTHRGESPVERPLGRVFGDRLMPLAERLTPTKIADIVYAFHHAEQAIMNNNMNPQLALEGALMSMRSPRVKQGAGSGFRRI